VELVSDGLGGAFATWDDVRSGNSDIYAQRVDADGNLMWSTAGVAVCTEDMRDQLDPQITRNGSGGVVIVWADSRTSYFDIYAQSLSGSGVAQWTIDGIAVCAAVDEQTAPHCVSNTAGDVTIVWEDERHGYDVDIYAQRIDAGGNALWTGTGVEICRAYANQQVTRIARDGENGVYISWVDYRSTNYDIYAQHVDAGGDIQWREGGIVVRAETQHAASLEMIFTERGPARTTSTRSTSPAPASPARSRRIFTTSATCPATRAAPSTSRGTRAPRTRVMIPISRTTRSGGRSTPRRRC
jgi:hypothetical protein